MKTKEMPIETQVPNPSTSPICSNNHAHATFSSTGLAGPVLPIVLLLSMLVHFVIAVNEDWDNLQVKQGRLFSQAERGLRLTESDNGLPLPIDNLLEQVLALPQGDSGTSHGSDCLNGSELSEMDVCLTPAQAEQFSSLSPFPSSGRRRRRQASANGFSLWKHGVIPYTFNSSFHAEDMNLILGAMSEWERMTCIRFRPSTREDTDVVVFRDGRRCSTNIGHIGGQQTVTLARTCISKRIMIHELGHVIGLIHEHQRHDRDTYVKVILENVRNMSQERYQFSKLLSGSMTDKTVKYDYTSVMHYGKNYFAKSPELTTLQTTESRFQDVIGRAEAPSFGDIETVNRLYRCSAGCPPSQRCNDESCFVDSSCTCRCSTSLDRSPLLDAASKSNLLLDSTCDLLAHRGECGGTLKSTVSLLCAKACGLLAAPTWTSPQPPSPQVNHVQPKPATSQWGTDPLIHGLVDVASNLWDRDAHALNDVIYSGGLPLPLNTDRSSASSRVLQDQTASLLTAHLEQPNYQHISNGPFTDQLRAALQQSQTTRASQIHLHSPVISSHVLNDKTRALMAARLENSQAHMNPHASLLASPFAPETANSLPVFLKTLLNKTSPSASTPLDGLSTLLRASHLHQSKHGDTMFQHNGHSQPRLQNRHDQNQTSNLPNVQEAEMQTLQGVFNFIYSRAHMKNIHGSTTHHSRTSSFSGHGERIKPDRTESSLQTNNPTPIGGFGFTEQHKIVEPAAESPATGTARHNNILSHTEYGSVAHTDQSGTVVNSSHPGSDLVQRFLTAELSLKLDLVPNHLSTVGSSSPQVNFMEPVPNQTWNPGVIPAIDLQSPMSQSQFAEASQLQNKPIPAGQHENADPNPQHTWDGTRNVVGNHELFLGYPNFHVQEPVGQLAVEVKPPPLVVHDHLLGASVDSSLNSPNFAAEHQKPVSASMTLDTFNIHQSFTDPFADFINSELPMTKQVTNSTQGKINPNFDNQNQPLTDISQCCSGAQAKPEMDYRVTNRTNPTFSLTSMLLRSINSDLLNFNTLSSTDGSNTRQHIHDPETSPRPFISQHLINNPSPIDGNNHVLQPEQFQSSSEPIGHHQNYRYLLRSDGLESVALLTPIRISQNQNTQTVNTAEFSGAIQHNTDEPIRPSNFNTADLNLRSFQETERQEQHH